jgi:hypothetical protein
VGAAPECGEAPGDLPVARKEELRGFLERSLTQGTILRSAGVFGLSVVRLKFSFFKNKSMWLMISCK